MDTRKFTMAYGDRIYARLSLNGKKIAEFMTDQVDGMTKLLGELRPYTRSLRGLCRLYVRNYSRGWSSERPLMLYAAKPIPQQHTPMVGGKFLFRTERTADHSRISACLAPPAATGRPLRAGFGFAS